MKPFFGPEESAAATEAIESGWVAQGPRVAAFERAMATKLHAAHGVAVSSCTTGLHLALIASGVGPGDEVVVPSLSFIATANVVRYTGAAPVFADVDLQTGNLTPESISAACTPATRAVILVHQGGVPADIEGVHGVCDPAGIAVVEDAACAIGSTFRGSPIGGHSDLVVFSFHPRKVITTGEGGMILTSRDDLAVRLRRLREHGMSVSAADRHHSTALVLEEYTETGYNYRMTDIQAAIGIVQLTRLDEIVRVRRSRARRYAAMLADIDGVTFVEEPTWGEANFQAAWAMLDPKFPLTRDELLMFLLERGVSARRGIMASHLEPAYSGAPCPPLPNTETLTRHSFILPLFHEMTDQEQDSIVGALRDAAALATVRGISTS